MSGYDNQGAESSDSFTGDQVRVLSGGAELIAATDSVLIDKQVATAKRYPRNLVQFREEAMMLVTSDEETAASCFYAIPRGGKWIEGESIRLAEIVHHCYRNLRWDGDIVGDDGKSVTAVSMCMDLERNNGVRIVTRRRIVVPGEDGVSLAGAAAVKTALRNSMFTAAPKALIRPIYMAAREASLGKNRTIGDLLEGLVNWFQAKHNVSQLQLCRALGVSTLAVGKRDGISKDHIINLKGLATMLREGEISIESVFSGEAYTGSFRSSGKRSAATDELRDRAAKAQAKAQPEAQDDQEAQADPEGTTDSQATDATEAREQAQEQEQAPDETPATQEATEPAAEDEAKMSREEAMAEALRLEAILVIKDGVLRTTRRREATDGDLDNVDNEALFGYLKYLVAEVAKKASRRGK